MHHGSNRYCLDKNYGGFLSVWIALLSILLYNNQNHHFCFAYFHRSGIASLGLSKTSGLMNRQCKTNLTLIDQVYFHFFFLQNASIYIFSDALASLALMIICNWLTDRNWRLAISHVWQFLHHPSRILSGGNISLVSLVTPVSLFWLVWLFQFMKSPWSVWPQFA